MLKSYLRAFKDLFFPAVCLSCGKKFSGEDLCPQCRGKIIFLFPPRCRYCWGELSSLQTDICKKCSNETYAYHQAISLTVYREPLVSLIHLFKYKNYDYLTRLFQALAEEYFSRIKFSAAGYDWISGVPLNRQRRKSRGYNQAQLLAEFLANYFKIPLRNDIIAAVNVRPSQTQFTGSQRWENVAGIFKVSKNLNGKNIILVDDVFTTGSTLNSCSSALKENGAGRITVITLAKTLSNKQ